MEIRRQWAECIAHWWARRVGKSYIVEEFAKNEYESYILIDFNNTMQQVLDLFRNYLYDLDTFFMYLQLYFNVKLTARKSLIIFDEVQAFPEARAAIKYLVKMDDTTILRQVHLFPSTRM